MKYLIVIAVLVITGYNTKSQVNLLRYNDNFEYLLKDSVSKKGTERLKYMKLYRTSTISIGGELREQLQYYRNINFGDVPPTFGKTTTWQLWQRLMVHANIGVSKNFRVFTQLGSTHRFINPNPLTPEIEQNDLSLQQAFIDFKNKSNLLLRIGRQELSYGSHRLITFREGPNTRLSFDGALLKYMSGKRRIELLAISPVISKNGVFDDQAFKDWIAGVYVSETFIPKWLNADYYAINFNSKRRQYNFIAGKENRQIAGIRLFSDKPVLNYELEASYQFGKFNNLYIKAFGIAFDVNHKLIPYKNIFVGVAGNYLTGDRNKDDRQLNTYNLLFSKPQYGLAAPIGATNMITANPYVKFNPNRNINIYTGINFMWRQSNQDGTYSPGAIQMRPRPEALFKSDENHVGTLWVLETAFMLNKHVIFAVDASYFAAGNYVKETGKGKDITYLSFKVNYKF